MQEHARAFYASVEKGAFPVMGDIVKGCAGFEPRLLFRLFLTGILGAQMTGELTAQAGESAAKNVDALRICYNNVTVYNQTPGAALEALWRDLFAVRRAERH